MRFKELAAQAPAEHKKAIVGTATVIAFD